MAHLILFIYLFIFNLHIVFGLPVDLLITDKLQLNADCDFEYGLCNGYEHDKTKDFNWTIRKGTTPSPNTGPDGDNTQGFNGQGHYLYIESSKKYNGELARIRTVTLTTTNMVQAEKLCLVFDYHMKGHTMGNLTVLLQEVPAGRDQILFRLSGNQGEGWKPAVIPIDTHKQYFKIVIEGSTSYSFYGDMAIDNIKLSKYSGEGCYGSPKHAVPKSTPSLPATPYGPENSTTCGLQQINKLPQAKGRVFLGVVSLSNAWPWMTMIQYRDPSYNTLKYRCGGTLLGTEWVITAAHCVTDIRSTQYLNIRVGAHHRESTSKDTQDVDISDIYVHEHYNTQQEFNNDVALIKLKRPVMLTKAVQSICLPKVNWEIEPGKNCFVTGWGKLYNDNEDSDDAPYATVLNQGQVPIRSQENCTKTYGNQVTQNMLCAGTDTGYPDTCVGDSGSPLVCQHEGRWLLVGITSWGHKIGCGYKGKYGVYTSIKEVQDWIKKVTMFTSVFKPLHHIEK